jgi:hypothetical protein
MVCALHAAYSIGPHVIVGLMDRHGTRVDISLASAFWGLDADGR